MQVETHVGLLLELAGKIPNTLRKTHYNNSLLNPQNWGSKSTIKYIDISQLNTSKTFDPINSPFDKTYRYITVYIYIYIYISLFFKPGLLAQCNALVFRQALDGTMEGEYIWSDAVTDNINNDTALTVEQNIRNTSIK